MEKILILEKGRRAFKIGTVGNYKGHEYIKLKEGWRRKSRFNSGKDKKQHDSEKKETK